MLTDSSPRRKRYPGLSQEYPIKKSGYKEQHFSFAPQIKRFVPETDGYKRKITHRYLKETSPHDPAALRAMVAQRVLTRSQELCDDDKNDTALASPNSATVIDEFPQQKALDSCETWHRNVTVHASGTRDTSGSPIQDRGVKVMNDNVHLPPATLAYARRAPGKPSTRIVLANANEQPARDYYNQLDTERQHT